MQPQFLIIDDSMASLESIRRSLKKMGFENATKLTDPTEAVAALSAGTLQPDIILIDYMMPEMNGVETCARIRLIDAMIDVPIIMLTGNESADILPNAFLAGANDYIAKPYEPSEFAARVRSCLRLKTEFDYRKYLEDKVDQLESKPRERSSRDRITVQPCLLSSEDFYVAIDAFPRENWQSMSFAAMCLDRAMTNTLPLGSLKARESLANILCHVPIPAGCLFAPLNSEVFCCAMQLDDPQEVNKVAQRFLLAVDKAALFDAKDPRRKPLELRIAVTRPQSESSIVGAIGDAISALTTSKASRSV